MFTYIDVVVPNADNRDEKPYYPDEKVENEKEKVSVVFEADAIVDPWAVVVHVEDAGAANATVVSSCRLYNLTVRADLVPLALQLCTGFCAIFHEPFDILL